MDTNNGSIFLINSLMIILLTVGSSMLLFDRKGDLEYSSFLTFGLKMDTFILIGFLVLIPISIIILNTMWISKLRDVTEEKTTEVLG